ncbi:hypothetical protein D3C87_1847980 [compost metagenome]
MRCVALVGEAMGQFPQLVLKSIFLGPCDTHGRAAHVLLTLEPSVPVRSDGFEVPVFQFNNENVTVSHDHQIELTFLAF